MKPDVIKNTSEACGLFPLNPKRIDFSKCISVQRKNLNGDYLPLEVNNNHIHLESINKTCLKLIESNIPTDLMSSFQEANNRNQNPLT